MQLSKELLGNVIGKEIKEFVIEKNELRYILENDTNSIPELYYINIYELAHKCKKWAILNHYDFTILIDTIVIYYEGIQVHTIYNTLKGDNFIPFDPAYEIKACQWILDNKDK